MNCQDARAYFSDLLDSHVGLTERVPLEAHLRECEACRKELEAVRVSQRPRPRPIAWRPDFKFDAFGKAVDRLRPADMLDRFRKRVFPRARAIRRARPRQAVFAKTPEAIPAPAEPSPRRSVHARERVPWRSRPPVARARQALASVRRIEIGAPLRRAGSSLDLILRRVPAALAVVWRLLGAVGSAVLYGGEKALQAARKALGAARAGVEAGEKVARIARRGLEGARRMVLLVVALVVLVWDHRRIFLVVPSRQLRLAAMLLLVSLGAVGLFRYRAELDLAVRRWVPSAPSSDEGTPPPRMASTEPATRPEIPPVTAPVTVVPAPPALHPSPAARPSAPEVPPKAVAPPARPKTSAPSPEPAAPRRTPAPSPPARDIRMSRVEKPEAPRPERIDMPTKAKNGSAKPDVSAVPAPRRDNPVGTVSPTVARPSGDSRPSLDVVGKLRVKSLSGGERDLAALVARAGGTTVSRQRGEKITVVEAVVPNPSYGKFAEGLTRIGSWQMEAGRTRLPDPVRVTVRLAE
jgi:hypothetical protein